MFYGPTACAAEISNPASFKLESLLIKVKENSVHHNLLVNAKTVSEIKLERLSEAV